MLNRIDHVGIAVPSLEAAIPFYRDALGLPFGGIEEVPGYGVRVAFFHVGESKIELLEPTSGDGMVAGSSRPVVTELCQLPHGPGGTAARREAP